MQPSEHSFSSRLPLHTQSTSQSLHWTINQWHESNLPCQVFFKNFPVFAELSYVLLIYLTRLELGTKAAVGTTASHHREWVEVGVLELPFLSALKCAWPYKILMLRFPKWKVVTGDVTLLSFEDGRNARKRLKKLHKLWIRPASLLTGSKPRNSVFSRCWARRALVMKLIAITKSRKLDQILSYTWGSHTVHLQRIRLARLRCVHSD